jgi:metal-responsive CopG/Arc/MetJ family transcriptional regulator
MRKYYPILSVRLPDDLIERIDEAAVAMFSTFPRNPRRGERTRFVEHALRSFLQEHCRPRPPQETKE